MAQPDKTIRCWRFGAWPALDRAAWTCGCTPVAPYGDPYGAPRPGATLRPDTLSKISKGYGRWLCFLDARGELDPDQPPLARVTRQRLRGYFHALRQAGNADYTVIGRFDELRKAMRILAPDVDVSWIDKPDGVSITALLPKRRRPMLVPDSGVLLAWARALMDQARAKTTAPRLRLIAYRDGLLLAMLAARGRRLRSMSLLRLAHEVLQLGEHYRIALTPDQVKTNRADHFGLPEALSPYVRYYLDMVRTALLAGRADDAFWISRDGTRLTAKAIQNQVFARTRKQFAQAFGPHRMRHAIATTAALRASGHPGLGAAVLNITGRTAAQSYNLAGQTAAALTFADLIEDRRRSSRGQHKPARQTR
jgi:site-specific recombinase XerC